jgi:hypothetical protein
MATNTTTAAMGMMASRQIKKMPEVGVIIGF